MRKLLLPFFILAVSGVLAQTALGHRISKSDTKKPLIAYLGEIERLYPVKFYFKEEWLRNDTILSRHTGSSLDKVLEDLFEGTDKNFLVPNLSMVVFVRDPARELKRAQTISKVITSGNTLNKVQVGSPQTVTKDLEFTVSGTVLNSEDKQPLVGVSVLVDEIAGLVTDASGMFTCKVKPGVHIFKFAYIGFDEYYVEANILGSGDFSVKLSEIPLLLDEVVVTDKQSKEIVTSAVGQTQLSMKEIKRSPALLGEVDIIKQIQTLAGVTTVSEAASGYNVRGGSVDQNLILYDGQPVFNSAHLFGFFSTFNSESVQDAVFYRGGIPSEYGGRISSVLDIRSREGNSEKWKGGAGIGIISSNFLIEGPIKKNKTTIIGSLRNTYSNWLIHKVRSNYIDLSKSVVAFYDMSFKLTHRFSNNAKLSASWYSSQDKFRLTSDSLFGWQTKLASVRYDQVLRDGLSLSINVGYGDYSYRVESMDAVNGFNLNYRLKYPSLKSEFLYISEGLKINAGIQSTYYQFSPGTFQPASPSSIRTFKSIADQQSLESGIYFTVQKSWLKILQVDLGLRAPWFASFGSADVLTYGQGVSKSKASILDTLSFSKHEIIKSYKGLEPRINLRWQLTPNASIKAAYNRIYQFMHLISNTAAISPVDIWQPSGYHIKPQLGIQYSLGFFRSSKNKNYESYVEAYYKDIQNVLDFKDGATLILNEALEADLLQGKARSFGVETQVSKILGRWQGSLSYSYSRSFRTVSGFYDDEKVNNGKEFRSNFDQPHVVNLNWRNGITRRIFFTGAFTYHTGRPITLPLYAYAVDNMTVTVFSERNVYRVPDYHRLDVGFVIEGNHKRKKLFDGTWTLSVYNVYGRKNPYSIFFQEVKPGILRPYRLAVIGSALPSISYSLRF